MLLQKTSLMVTECIVKIEKSFEALDRQVGYQENQSRRDNLHNDDIDESKKRKMTVDGGQTFSIMHSVSPMFRWNVDTELAHAPCTIFIRLVFQAEGAYPV